MNNKIYRKSMVLMIAVFFIFVSIVHVSGLKTNLINSELSKRVINDSLIPSISLYLEYDKERGDELKDNHSSHFRNNIMNHSEYLGDDSSFYYSDCDEFWDGYNHRYDKEFVKKEINNSESPKTKPNFLDGDTFYVDDDSECPGDGSIEWPFCKIQYAIDNSFDGDTVYVYDGIYFENVIINKSIILHGENRNTTIIDCNRIGDAISIPVSYVEISGFTVQNSSWPWAGIILGSSLNNISGNIFSNNSYFGIKLMNAPVNTIMGNEIINNDKYGIYLESWGGLSNSDWNFILGNNITNNGQGIFLDSACDYNNIQENNITIIIYY